MDLLQLQKKYLLEKFGKRPNQLDKREAILGIVGELGEMTLNKSVLPWKKQDSLENLLEEGTDVLFFLLEYFLAHGIESWEEVEKMYLNKLEKDMQRKDHDNW